MYDRYAELLGYLSAMWRRRWYALAIAVLMCLAGWISVAFVPNSYTSSAKIYVDTETVLRPLLRGLAVEPNVESEVAIMQQTLLTRPNLAKVARATDLDLDTATPERQEAVLAFIRERTTVEALQPNLFSISFKDRNPERARDAVQAFLNIFMENRLGESRSEMDIARRFIDEQIEDYQRQLDEAEKRLAEFKQMNLRVLPGGPGYQQRLDEAKAQLTAEQAALDDATSERDALREQLQSMPEIIAAMPNGNAGPPSDYSLRIVQLQTELDQLLQKYTDKHPDVVNIRTRIKELQAQEAADQAAALAPPEQAAGDGERSTKPQYGVLNPAYGQLQLILAEKEAEIARQRERVDRQQKTVEALEAVALEVPLVEAQLKQLTRDYDVVKARYGDLLERRESAKMSRDREARGEKVQFRIIEPPEIPAIASGPDRPLLLSAVLPIGVGLGLAFAFVLALLSDTFANPRRLGEELDLPVLGAISLVYHPSERGWRIIDWTAFALLLALVLGIYGLLMTVEKNVGLNRVTTAAMNAPSFSQAFSVVSDSVTRALSAPSS